MASGTKKQRRVEGDILRIDLTRGEWTFARVLPHGVFAFYDCFGCDDLDTQRILGAPVLFRIPVMNKAVTSGRWKVVGNAPLEPSLLAPSAFAKQDGLDKSYAISVGGLERRATREECLPLERLAVWSAEHVEDRLRDHRAGRKNKWVESLRIT